MEQLLVQMPRQLKRTLDNAAKRLAKLKLAYPMITCGRNQTSEFVLDTKGDLKHDGRTGGR